MMEEEVVRVAGITMEEARTQIMGTVKTVTIVSLTVGIIALILLALLMNFLVVRPLKKTVAEIDRIARYDLTEGDMANVRSMTARKDEIGSISRNIVLMFDTAQYRAADRAVVDHGFGQCSCTCRPDKAVKTFFR